MADYKEQLIKAVTEGLLNDLSDTEIGRVSDELAKALKEYDIAKKETAIVPYVGLNENIVKRFCACLAIGGKSEKTIAQYKRTVEHLFKAAQKNYTDIGVYDIRMFLAFEKQRGISNRTLENTRANLSAFFQWLVAEELIIKNPCMNIKPIKYTDKVRLPFSQVDIYKLRFACKNDKQRAIIELLLSSGIRVSEMTNLKIKDIDFYGKSIHITKGKGDKERTAYMSDLARANITNYLNDRKSDSEYLICNEYGNPINPGGVRSILRTLGKKAGVDNVHPHRFRRTFATDLANRGMDIQEIKKLLGHSDINTTLEYVYTSDEKAHASYLRYSA